MDHTVSGKEFELRFNEELDMLVTFPQPEAEKLSEYYKSENYISHTDAKKSFLDKIYQKVKTFMINKKMKWIENEKSQGGKILDIGAGTGDFLIKAKTNGWNVEGVEPNLKARELAAKKGIILQETTKALLSNSYDVISMWHVLEHIPDLEEQIQELDRLVKKDGLLVIAVPNFKSYDAYVYKNAWAAFDVPRHLWHFSRNSIKKIFQKNNFEQTFTKGLKFDAFYVSLLSEKYRTGSGNFLKGIWIGFLSNLMAGRNKEYSSIAYFLKKK